MAASVQGPEFDSAVVARVLGREAADVEERLEVLERVHFMVSLIREQTFPDRTLTLRYGFVHILYQNALYMQSFSLTRRAAWSGAAARALLDHHAEKSTGLAAELAMLFEAARDPETAAEHYLVASENAGRMFAHHEAVALARRGLAQLDTVSETPERARRELPLLVVLAMQIQVSQGFAAPEAEHIYTRARDLYEQLHEETPLIPAIWGLWMFYEVGGEPRKSWSPGRSGCLHAGPEGPTTAPSSFRRARRWRSRPSALATRPSRANIWSKGSRSTTLERDTEATVIFMGRILEWVALPWARCALWQLGYPDQAAARSREAIAIAGESGQPSSLALALHFGAILSKNRGEPSVVRENAEAIAEIATEHGLSFWRAAAPIMRGWALAKQGAGVLAIAELRHGLDALRATGARTYETYYTALLAEALGWDGQFEEGLRVLDGAMAWMREIGEHFNAPELHRLQGELLLLREPAERTWHEAEACFLRALASARQQQTKSFELRAAMSLTRLDQRQNRAGDALAMLAECYEWFTEGFDTSDLQEARSLLDQLS